MQRDYAAASRWPDIFRDIRRTQDEINNLFGGLRLVPRAEFPPINLWAGSDGAVVAAEMPGVNPEQIDIAVHQDTLTIKGKREPEKVEGEAVAQRQERAQGSFARTVILPFRVDAERVSARFDRGVLRLELPRPDADKPHQIKVARA